MPSTTAGPVQPFGVRRMIAGHWWRTGRLGPSPSLASAWIDRIESWADRSAASSAGNTWRGSSPATVTGSQPWLRR